MTRLSLSLLFLLATTQLAQAACFADYKAKRDDPLRLHYGVAEIRGTCETAAAELELQPRLASDGWTLLTVLDVFEEDGAEERKDSAGDYYLRY